MKEIFGVLLGVFYNFIMPACYAADKFDILPDLPEPLLNAAQASAVSTNDSAALTTQAVGNEPNFISMIVSLAFVIVLIYLTGILYTKLNRFGANALRKQIGEKDISRVSVISTTPLGQNKSLHVVELDGKRMLIGASSGAIQLIKDLGSYPPYEIEDGEFSKIEIPNIRIPKIEIPRIEIPGFTKVVSKKKSESAVSEKNETNMNNIADEHEDEKFEFSEIYEEENSDGIIDKLFQTTTENISVNNIDEIKDSEHTVDPDEYVLYKKYL